VRPEVFPVELAAPQDFKRAISDDFGNHAESARLTICTVPETRLTLSINDGNRKEIAIARQKAHVNNACYELDAAGCLKSSPRLLLVDDEQALRRQIRRILFSQTFEGIIRVGAIDRVDQGLVDTLGDRVVVVELRRFERAGRDRADEKGRLGVAFIRDDLFGPVVS
jgi:hypothetical protein